MGIVIVVVVLVLIVGAIRVATEILSEDTLDRVSKVIGAIALPAAVLFLVPGVVLLFFGLLMGLLSPNFNGSPQVWGARQFFGAGFKLCLLATLAGSLFGASQYVEDELQSAYGRDKQLLNVGQTGILIVSVAGVLCLLLGFRPIAGWVFTN